MGDSQVEDRHKRDRPDSWGSSLVRTGTAGTGSERQTQKDRPRKTGPVRTGPEGQAHKDRPNKDRSIRTCLVRMG